MANCSTSVSKYLIRRRKPLLQTWRTFLNNHLKTWSRSTFSRADDPLGPAVQVIVVNQGSLRKTLSSYFSYYHETMPNLSLAPRSRGRFSCRTWGEWWPSLRLETASSIRTEPPEVEFLPTRSDRRRAWFAHFHAWGHSSRPAEAVVAVSTGSFRPGLLPYGSKHTRGETGIWHRPNRLWESPMWIAQIVTGRKARPFRSACFCCESRRSPASLQ